MSDDDFLSRWSKRKRALEVEPAQEQTEPLATADPDVPEKTEAEVLEELGLRDPDEMDAGDDFSGFMKSAVPTRLRNRALRKLWLTNPALANLDELLDYGEDYTDAATVIENMQTAYQVGKGWLKDVVQEDVVEEDAPAEPEAPADEEVAALEEQPAPEAETEPRATSEAAPEPEALEQHGLSTAPPVSDSIPVEEADPELPRPRRMKFRFSA